MSIEFFCDACFTKVVTPDSTGGKKGRCPSCGKVVQIPEQTAEQAAPKTISVPDNYVPPRSGPSTLAASAAGIDNIVPEKETEKVTADKRRLKSKLGDYEWESKAHEKQWGNFNPVDRNRAKRERRLESIRAITAPGVALLVTAVINMILVILAIAGLAFMVVLQFTRNQNLEADTEMAGLVFWCVGLAIWLAVYAIIIIGANHMRMARNYTMAMTGAVVAVLPINPCMILTIPFGIWAIMVLANRRVRIGFRST